MVTLKVPPELRLLKEGLPTQPQSWCPREVLARIMRDILFCARRDGIASPNFIL